MEEMNIIMKKTRSILMRVLLAVLLLTGCGAIKFDTTTVFGKTTIKVNNAEDGATGESGAIIINKNQTMKIESALDSGSLEIAFCDAVDVSIDDEDETYEAGEIITTVTIGPDETVEVPLSAGIYIMQYTAVGTTNGTITAAVN